MLQPSLRINEWGNRKNGGHVECEQAIGGTWGHSRATTWALKRPVRRRHHAAIATSQSTKPGISKAGQPCRRCNLLEIPHQCGDPSDAKYMIDPLINQRAVDGVTAKIEKAKVEGSTMRLGGSVKGRVVPPHSFTEVLPHHELANVEIFGAVLPIVMFSSDAEALALANDTEYGLASAVFSGNLARAERFAQGMETGMTNINVQTVPTDIYGPFGGEKNAGAGHFNGQWIIEEFTRLHWITRQDQRRPFAF